MPSRMTWEEAMAYLAQGVINIAEGLSAIEAGSAVQIEAGSAIHKGMEEVCLQIDRFQKGETPHCPCCGFVPTKLSREEIHEYIAHLYWKFRESTLPTADFAEFLLITMYRQGALAPGLVPDGPDTAQSWPQKDDS